MVKLVDRIMSFESHCIETNNPEGAEILHYSAKRIEELEAALSETYEQVYDNPAIDSLIDRVLNH